MSVRAILLLIVFSIPVISCTRQEKTPLPGYVEGRYTYVAANYSGILKNLYVKRGDEVIANQPLFALEKEPQQDLLLAKEAQVKQAKATIEQWEAQVNLRKLILDRRVRLESRRVISKEELDSSLYRFQEASSNLAAAKAHLEALQAELAKARWDVGQKLSDAPVSGLVFDTYFTQGELVISGYPVVSLLNPDEVKIIFYVPEVLLSTLKLKQNIDVACDSCKQKLQGSIVYISDKAEYTPPVIYSNEMRKKLVYRVEAKPATTKAYLNIHPGQPVSVFLR